MFMLPLVILNPLIPYYGLFLCDIQISVLQIEIHQTSEDQSVRGATHYDIIKDNDIVRDTHYVTMGNDVTRDILCDVTMSKDIAMCTYHGITMHNGIAMNLFVMYYDKFMFDQSGLENTFVVFM